MAGDRSGEVVTSYTVFCVWGKIAPAGVCIVMGLYNVCTAAVEMNMAVASDTPCCKSGLPYSSLNNDLYGYLCLSSTADSFPW